jgi:N-hydroxyarylamine O-acetyltransferase
VPITRPGECMWGGGGRARRLRVTVIDEPRLPDTVADAYLALLDVDVAQGAVDAAALTRLQRSHVEKGVYETVDICLGRPPGIDAVDSARRVVGGRGGYCFHLNGAFSALLMWLGVDVTRHVAGVQNRMTPEPVGPNGNHLGLTVRLPDGSRWLVDVGLGDGPAEPLPLEFGTHDQRAYHYALGPSTCGDGIWRFDHDPSGGFFGFDVDLRGPATMTSFDAMHTQLSTNSRFTQTVTVQRRRGDRIECLRGCVLSEISPNGTHKTDVTSGRDWWSLVIDRFGLAYGDLPRDERERLWTFVRSGHDAWLASSAP